MKITKEKFNELSQLDRIEFRQKYNLIREPTNYMFIVTFIFMATGWFLASMLGIIGTIYHWKLFIKRNKKLEEEYFTTQVKRNERGKC